MTDKSKKILSEVSAGELLDKISILEIKLVKIKNENDLNFIKKEYEILKKTQDTFIKTDDEILSLFNMLKDINLKLWNIEDKLRICEKNKDFKEEFVKLAREVYLTNDKRANIKLKINTIIGSDIREIKQYIKY